MTRFVPLLAMIGHCRMLSSSGGIYKYMSSLLSRALHDSRGQVLIRKLPGDLMFLTACTQPKYALATFEITKENQKTVGKLLNSTAVQLC